MQSPSVHEFEVPRLHFLTPVWSDEYVRFFLEVSLPSLLSPGNLFALTRPATCLFHILTFAEEAARIEAHPAIARLRDILPVRIETIECRGATNHDTMSLALRRGIDAADAADAASLFCNPDFVYGDGSIRSLAKWAAEGKRAVFGLGVRMRKETVEPVLMREYAAGHQISIANRQLVRLVVDHLHPIGHQHFWLEGDEPMIPANLYWRVDGQGFLAHCFHLHPFMVWPRSKGTAFSGTVDDDYVLYAAPQAEDRLVIDSSEDFFVAEVSSSGHHVDSPFRKRRAAAIADWAELAASELHRQLFAVPIRSYTDTPQPAAWEATEVDAAAAVREVYRRLGRSTARIFVEQPLVGLRRLLRLAREAQSQAHNNLRGRSRWAEAFSSAFRLYSDICRRYVGLRDGLWRSLFGTVVTPRPVNPRWVLSRGALEQVAAHLEPAASSSTGGRRLLILNGDATLTERLRALFPDASIISPPMLATAIGAAAETAPERDIGTGWSAILAIFIDSYLAQAPDLSDQLAGRLAPAGRLIVMRELGSGRGRPAPPGGVSADTYLLPGTRATLPVLNFLTAIGRRAHPSPILLEIPFVPIAWLLLAASSLLLSATAVVGDRLFGQRPTDAWISTRDSTS